MRTCWPLCFKVKVRVEFRVRTVFRLGGGAREYIISMMSSQAYKDKQVCVYSRFLPSLARASLQKNLANCSIQETPDPEHTQDHSCEFQSFS